MLGLFLLGFFCLISANEDIHEKFQLVHIYPKNDHHRSFLEGLREHHDVWYASYDRYDILLPSSQMKSMEESFSDLSIPSQIVVDDMNSLIIDEAERLANKAPVFDYEDFNNLTLTYSELDKIAAKCIEGFVCSVDSIGDSVEKRPIRRLKITKKGVSRKIVWVDSLTHAREWLTSATLFKIIKHFQDNYKIDPDVKSLLDKYDWYFVPVINPDGYEFSWDRSSIKNRMWRKNRRINPKPDCPGVDLNRNADSAWGTAGASPEQCAETYRGPSIASEPETQACQKHFSSLGSNLLELVSLHAYGQYWLTSFGHIDNKTNQCYVAPDANETLRVANAAADAIEDVYNTNWKRGPSCSTIYPNCGGITDYAKGKAGVSYTAVPEVRGGSFIVPPTEITPSFKEIWAGILASIRAIEKRPQN